MQLQSVYRFLLQPLLFSLPPETAHDLILGTVERLGVPSVPPLPEEVGARLRTNAMGLTFATPVGLAAGFDKNARAVNGLSRLGFGFIEVGTVTPKPQPGNPRPRMFRLPKAGALINRLGFNNEGADAMAGRFARLGQRRVPIGINIGRNKVTPNEQAVDDYLACLKTLFPYGDYFVVNVSSPNTPGLRQLQDPEHLGRLLQRLQQTNREMAERQQSPPKPLLVKIAPELGAAELDGVCEAARRAELAGIIATNTTTQRDAVAHLPHGRESGGLSGAPLTVRANQIMAALHRRVGGEMVLIGVGGIGTPWEAYRRIRAGAQLVQIYTGFVYFGPGLPRALAVELVKEASYHGFDHIQDAVGVDADTYPEPELLLPPDAGDQPAGKT